MGSRMSVGRSALIAAVAGGALFATGTPAVADAPNMFTSYAFGTCDTTTGNWIVDWQLGNESDQTATLLNLAVSPREYPIEGLPATIAPRTTVHATQHLVGTPGLTSTLTGTIQWTDGETRTLNWSFRPRTVCNKA
jgi:hypothetical protein